jgi:cytochrome c oxidase subunit 2
VNTPTQANVHAPRGAPAHDIDALAGFLYGVSTLVWVLVVVALAYALLRRRRPGEVREGPRAERTMSAAVGAATALTVAILFTFLWLTLTTNRAMSALWSSDALEIELIGHQWWWEVRYPHPDAYRVVTTANEMHVPAGRRIVVTTRSRDVIHSFWVPSLGARRDLVPGYAGTVTFQADEPGLYRAPCAEFCGHQHALMALLVVAEPEREFRAWLERERQATPPPPSAAVRRGQAVFEGGSCALCHTVRGTLAAGRVGPELTHLAARRTIGAGTLPNTREHLRDWVTDPQAVKPGVRMPATPMRRDDLEALLTFLESLR